MSWTCYVILDLWQYFGIVFEFPKTIGGLCGGIYRVNWAVFEPFFTFSEGYRHCTIPNAVKTPCHGLIMLYWTFGNTLAWFLNFPRPYEVSAGVYRVYRVLTHFSYFQTDIDIIPYNHHINTNNGF